MSYNIWVTLDTAIQSFLEYCELERNRSIKTRQNYAHYLRRFQEWADKRIATPADITAPLVREYRLHLNRLTTHDGELLKTNTKNYHLIALRAFLKYLAKQDIPSLSAEKIEMSKQLQSSVQFLESEEVERLLAAPNTKTIQGIRDRAILEVLFSTGLRVSELVGLNRTQLSTERNELSVRGKGGKIRIVFFSDSARTWLKTYLEKRQDPEVAVFIPHQKKLAVAGEKETRLTVRQVQRLIKKYAIAAGITKDISPHTLRHSFATDLLFNGADLRSVQALLGHASITTTQVYTHITNRQLRDVHRAFHGTRRKRPSVTP